VALFLCLSFERKEASAMLTDEAFIGAFEAATLPGDQFTHAAHVRAGWWYLRHYPIGEAIDRFSRSLRAFAAAQGADRKYHETMTVVWMLLIAERLGMNPDLGWEEFAAHHPDLLATSLLARYYSDATLTSDAARQRFVMPDRAPARL
jgi:hypothetical protein